MAIDEGLKLELELEVKRLEVEIKEKEIEIFNNETESIICKEKIEEKVPEDEIKDYLSGNKSNNIFLTSNIKRIGLLTYKNYCLEDEKFGLISIKEDILKQIEEYKRELF